MPAVGLYPFQWCWDSGPIALGWAAAGHWDLVGELLMVDLCLSEPAYPADAWARLGAGSAAERSAAYRRMRSCML